MKLYKFLFLLFSIPDSSIAQYVSLNSVEIMQLKSLIARDTEIAKLYSPFQIRASAALNTNPNPVDTIISEGHLATDPKKIATLRSLVDVNRIYALSLVYRVSNDSKYLEKASEFLVAWALTNKPNGNPINDTKFGDAIRGYDLIKNELAPDANDTIKNWLRDMAMSEINSKRLKGSMLGGGNNWNSHRLKVVGMIAYALGDTVLQTMANAGLAKQIEYNLDADGSGKDFKERDALHYHIYSLEPLLELSIVIRRATKMNFYTYRSDSGSSIENSIKFLLPFVRANKTHEEFVNSTVPFDRARANNNEPDFKTGALLSPRMRKPFYRWPNILIRLTSPM